MKIGNFRWLEKRKFHLIWIFRSLGLDLRNLNRWLNIMNNWLLWHVSLIMNRCNLVQNITGNLRSIVQNGLGIPVLGNLGEDILIIDFNPWGEPTSPLIFRTWDRDWQEEAGIKIIEPPVQVGGDVNVSF